MIPALFFLVLLHGLVSAQENDRISLPHLRARVPDYQPMCGRLGPVLHSSILPTVRTALHQLSGDDRHIIFTNDGPQQQSIDQRLGLINHLPSVLEGPSFQLEFQTPGFQGYDRPRVLDYDEVSLLLGELIRVCGENQRRYPRGIIHISQIPPIVAEIRPANPRRPVAPYVGPAALPNPPQRPPTVPQVPAGQIPAQRPPAVPQVPAVGQVSAGQDPAGHAPRPNNVSPAERLGSWYQLDHGFISSDEDVNLDNRANGGHLVCSSRYLAFMSTKDRAKVIGLYIHTLQQYMLDPQNPMQKFYWSLQGVGVMVDHPIDVKMADRMMKSLIVNCATRDGGPGRAFLGGELTLNGIKMRLFRDIE